MTANRTVELCERRAGDLAILDYGTAAPRPLKLLVLKLDHIGDFFIALPALEKLRRAFRGDHITLLCGPWISDFARAAGIADEVRTYRFFPEDGSRWDGDPVESLDMFRQTAGGPFDIAIDLRFDEDTRFLLGHVEAGLKCGIGSHGAAPVSRPGHACAIRESRERPGDLRPAAPVSIAPADQDADLP